VAGAAAGEAGEPGRRKGNGSDRWTPPVGGREREEGEDGPLRGIEPGPVGRPG
jgi:hypothetical protein